MTPRAARTVATCSIISYAVMIVAVIAVLLVRNWIFAGFIVLAVTMVRSRNIYVGYVPLQFPGFDDRVAGLMLGGTSEEAAIREASFGESVQAVGSTIIGSLICVVLVLVAYGVSFHLGLSVDAIGAIVRQAALWLVGIGVLGIILPLGLVAFSLRNTKRPNS
jgi:hypothetical protein